MGYLVGEDIFVVATTHHRSVAVYAEMNTRMMNASVALDERELRPTYEITMGIPGRSYAMTIADNLGLPREIMAVAVALLETQHVEFEAWLNELHQGRRKLEKKLKEADEARVSARITQCEIESQLEDLAASIRRSFFFTFSA